MLGGLRVSSYHTTVPVGMAPDAPDFLNAAAVGETALPPRDLLHALLAIEAERGRERPWGGASRTLDLDLVLYGDHIIDEPPVLMVPHPKFRERLFVLNPMAEIAGDMRDPVSGKTVEELVRECTGRGGLE